MGRHKWEPVAVRRPRIRLHDRSFARTRRWLALWHVARIRHADDRRLGDLGKLVQHVLDLGANVDSSPQQLFQFAVMGSVLAEAIDSTHKPKVGLLNIGSEDSKGNAQVKAANDLLQSGSFNYIGYVEGDDIYSDKVDVVVCDGFVGNISLKTMEGVAKMIATMMREEFNRSILSKLAGLISWPVLSRFKKRVDPRMYNGASMLGLTGIVIKSHGSADVLSYANAIQIALLEVEKRVPEHIRECMEPLLKLDEVATDSGNTEQVKEATGQEKTQLESEA